MRLYVFTLTGSCLFLFLCPPSHGQTSSKAPCGDLQKVAEDKDPIAIVELGAATNWNLSGGAATFAPNLAVEVTPIENWLELEVGVSPFYTRKSTEWDTDLLFKKPWTISRKAELMLGVGPEWVHLRQNGKVTNSISGETRETSCSGRAANTVSAGSSNPLTTTVLPEATTNPSV
ncbi:MAG: hypothetical protein WB762_01540 [Candidatus Sulfotelmatobacter sp.]